MDRNRSTFVKPDTAGVRAYSLLNWEGTPRAHSIFFLLTYPQEEKMGIRTS